MKSVKLYKCFRLCQIHAEIPIHIHISQRPNPVRLDPVCNSTTRRPIQRAPSAPCPPDGCLARRRPSRPARSGIPCRAVNRDVGHSPGSAGSEWDIPAEAQLTASKGCNCTSGTAAAAAAAGVPEPAGSAVARRSARSCSGDRRKTPRRRPAWPWRRGCQGAEWCRGRHPEPGSRCSASFVDRHRPMVHTCWCGRLGSHRRRGLLPDRRAAAWLERVSAGPTSA